jgi:hypothetical protein
LTKSWGNLQGTNKNIVAQLSVCSGGCVDKLSAPKIRIIIVVCSSCLFGLVNLGLQKFKETCEVPLTESQQAPAAVWVVCRKALVRNARKRCNFHPGNGTIQR